MGYKLKRILIYPDGVTEKLVRPVWKPNANTIAYRPLESNANDIVGGYNGTNISGISYDTLASGKKVAKTTSNSANISIPGASILPLLGTGDFTISCWVYLTGVYATGSNRVSLLFWVGNNSSPYPGPSIWLNKNATSWGNGGIFYSTQLAAGGNSTISYNDALNKWLNLVYTRNNGTFKGYINGVTECTFSSSINYNTGSIGFLFCRGDSNQQLVAGSMGSEFILEKTARDDAQIKQYYSLTKGKYGL